MRRAIATCLVLVPVGLSLAGCGYSPGDRALSGGLIGAGGGAAIAGHNRWQPTGGRGDRRRSRGARRRPDQRSRHQSRAADLALTDHRLDQAFAGNLQQVAVLNAGHSNRTGIPHVDTHFWHPTSRGLTIRSYNSPADDHRSGALGRTGRVTQSCCVLSSQELRIVSRGS
jgi:hypothetical protein